MLLRDSGRDERRRPVTSGDQRLRLNDALLERHVREIFWTGTRKDLDALTRRLWKMYNNGLNDAELEELKQRILERREMVARNDPR